MAASGLGSRRALEQRIRNGDVTVNRRRATLGQSVGPGDRVRLDEREWRVSGAQTPHRTLLYNKPEGEVTTRADEAGRATVFDRLPPLEGLRWVAIGRLDIATTGLLILTTDGELANAMMHPSNRVDREYVCRVRGDVSADTLEALRSGVELDDGPARFSDLQPIGVSGHNPWFQATLLEGRNREVRRLWASQGHQVSRLKRVRYGAASLPRGLRIGRWREISAAEHRVLREDVGLPSLPEHLVLVPAGKERSTPNTERKRNRAGSKGRRASRPGKPRAGGNRR